ncbi:MAG: RNA 2',3'-cyclic phosphodiesterase [Candidatus Latescibacterota bacterium]|nr:MAG: RNA 2',3'-cyclic phosphodiesterase [Candidatus Latescibacterota bacterium]
MRLFFAVGFSDSLKDAIEEAIKGIDLSHPPWRWVATVNFHITLKFLGETREEKVAALVRSAATAFEDAKPFEITLGGLGGFPNLNRPRVLFYRVTHGADPLCALAAKLEDALHRDLSIEKERRSFRAHATVARIKKPIPKEVAIRLQDAPGVSHPLETVENVKLMRSELRREGALYHVVKEIALS